MPGDPVRHRATQALLLIDVVNHFEFPDGEDLLHNALPLAPRLRGLKRIARAANVPVIYVNDNFGQWQSDAAKLVTYCLRSKCAGRRFVETIRPTGRDYCVLKPMHSAFFQTPLDLLLHKLGACSLVLAGLATNSCILCTAHDANMRNFQVTVMEDCCAARTHAEHRAALDNIQKMAGAHIVASSSFRFERAAKGS
jgi:nicotinamidase-related amidase